MRCSALLLAHELDAVRAGEWRPLPVLRSLPDARGRDMFILAYVPLVAALIWLAAYPPGARYGSGSRRRLMRSWSSRWRCTGPSLHPDHDFRGALSRGLILGAGAVGALHAALLARVAGSIVIPGRLTRPPGIRQRPQIATTRGTP